MGGAQTPVGARRLTKAMLLRHIFLKKAGQVGFMMKCSRRTRSSVNRVLGGRENNVRYTDRRVYDTQRGSDRQTYTVHGRTKTDY